MVSIIVVTYNSAATLVETLESISNQTYRDFEVIISDDGSRDQTREIAEEWCKKNLDPKINPYTVIPNKVNTGIPSNCNRGLKKASGDWVKFIAGDDKLAVQCLEDNIKYIESNSLAKVVFSKMKTFIGENESSLIFKSKEYPYERHYKFFDLNAQNQYKYFLIDSFNVAPVAFLNRKVLDELGGFDERFQFIEDLPMWLKLMQNGFKIHFFPKVTVFYRVNFGISASKNNLYSPLFTRSYLDIHKKIIIPNVPFYKFSYWNNYYLLKLKLLLADRLFNNIATERSLMLMKKLEYLNLNYSFNVFKGLILKIVKPNLVTNNKNEPN